MRTSILIAIVFPQLFCTSLRAQDADTIMLQENNRKFTILSQIENPVEAATFLSILSAKEPATRGDLAAAFIRNYPQSWLLAQAYDLSARAAVDKGNFDRALEDGRFSLRLVPENPALLVLIGNLEAQNKHFDDAIRNAGDAIEYLDQLERPPNLNQGEWNEIRPELKASAYFARARAETSRGMAERSATELDRALEDLNMAAAWNSGDPEVFYLRAVVEIELQRKIAAASDLAFVFGSSSILREKAKSILGVLSKQSSTEATPLDVFIKGLPPRTIDPGLRREPRTLADTQAVRYGYAGPEACRQCHESQYSAWRKTGMARMLQPYRPENIVGDFSPRMQYVDTEGSRTGSSVIRLGSASRPYFEMFNAGHWVRYYVDFTIGSKWQQAYATKLPDGRLQVLPIEYNLLEKKWINYWRMIDPPGSSRANLLDFPKLTSATNYQKNCAICHTSQLKADVAMSNSMEHASFLQPGIDCEMCHGPSKWHIRQVQMGIGEPPDAFQSPINFRKVNNRDGVRVCAQCHRQSAVREIGEGGEMNYSTGANFIPTAWLRPYDAFSRKAFYKDGRFRETTFIVEAFTRSACYLRGTAQCATCHSPHLGDFELNQTALKFRANPNEMCLGCHSKFRNRIAEHSRHQATSEASQCVTCHMPRIMNALLFKARSHQIEVPSADLTERFSQQDSPNVCLMCHSQESPGWARGQLALWRH